jgi:hypothetical protein
MQAATVAVDFQVTVELELTSTLWPGPNRFPDASRGTATTKTDAVTSFGARVAVALNVDWALFAGVAV